MRYVEYENAVYRGPDGPGNPMGEVNVDGAWKPAGKLGLDAAMYGSPVEEDEVKALTGDAAAKPA